MLTDSTAIVLGASSGIGRASAKKLANQGADITIASRDRSKLKSLRSEIENTDTEVRVVPTDVRNTDEVNDLFSRSIQKFGKIDIVANSVGTAHWETLLNSDPSMWEHEVELNLLSLMRVTQQAARVMVKQGFGHIVNISSTSGRFPNAQAPGYTATKFGVNGFTKSVHQYLRSEGIRVSLIEPDTVDTPMHSNDFRESATMLSPESVASAVLYCVSQPSSVCIADMRILTNG